MFTTHPQLLSKRVQALKLSGTIAIADKVRRLAEAGQAIINLSIGEPDFDTPDAIKTAAIEAMQAGETHYTPVGGTKRIRQAIVSKLQRENHLSYDITQILVSCGAKHSLFNACQALINEGDEVIIPVPYWTSYPEMVRLAGGVPVMLPTHLSSQLKITAEQLQRSITRKTKLLILNSPSNPSGMVYTDKELAAIGSVLMQHPNILVLCDDIYEHITWDLPCPHLLNSCPAIKEQTLVINGVSKAYAMTGWRIGYTAGPAHIIAAMRKIQSQSTSGPNSIAQAAAAAALDGDQACIRDMRDVFKDRYQLIQPMVDDLPGVTCPPSQATFYLFPHVKAAIEAKGLKDDIAFANALIDEAKVAVVPGSAFGAPDHIRLSLTADKPILVEAVQRLKQSIAKPS